MICLDFLALPLLHTTSLLLVRSGLIALKTLLLFTYVTKLALSTCLEGALKCVKPIKVKNTSIASLANGAIASPPLRDELVSV